MTMPKFDEAFMPILEILRDGEIVKTRDMGPVLLASKFFTLTDDELTQKTASGGRIFFDRISWGISYLKKGKFVEQPERGVVKISTKGLDWLKGGKELTLRLLKEDGDYIAHDKKVAINNKKEKALDSGDVTPQDMIDLGMDTLIEDLKNDLLERLKIVNPYYFEDVILILFKKMGYGDFTRTSRSNDGGVDGIINQDALGVEKIYTQAKRYVDHAVGGRDMTNFIGAISRDGVNKGIFVTTSTFSKSAEDIAMRARDKIVLIDGTRLVGLMIAYNVGVQVKAKHEIKEIDEDFFDAE